MGRELIPEGRLALLAGAGLAALLAVLLAALALPGEAMRALLTAGAFAIGLPIGAVAVLLMMSLVPGPWVEALGGAMEAAARLAPLAAVLLLPALIGWSALYPAPEGEGFRAVWTGRVFFSIRAVVFLALLIVLAHRLVVRGERGTATAVLGLVFVAIFGSAVAVDWLMALSPDFVSSGFGLYLLSIWLCVAVLSGGILALAGGTRHPGVVGALMLTTLLLWAYLDFMQYLIVWSGDLAHKVGWFEVRGGAEWGALLWTLSLLSAVPMMLMLLPRVLSSRRALIPLAAMALAGKALELVWIVLPSAPFSAAGVLLALLALAGAAALVGAVYLTAASGRRRGEAPARDGRVTA